MTNENQAEIENARKTLQTMPDWMALQIAKCVSEFQEPAEERWLETKKIILDFLDDFAGRNGYGCTYEEYNSLDFAVNITAEQITVDKNDFEALMVLAAADEITAKVTDDGKIELKVVYARYQNGMIFHWL